MEHEDHESEITNWLKLEVNETPFEGSYCSNSIPFSFKEKEEYQFLNGFNNPDSNSSYNSCYQNPAPMNFPTMINSTKTNDQPLHSAHSHQTNGFPQSNTQSLPFQFQLNPTFQMGPNGVPAIDLQQLSTNQIYSLYSQLNEMIKSHTPPMTTPTVTTTHNDEDSFDDRKKNKERANRTVVRRVRQTRPKVVEAKGAMQCKGRNRKKGIQCRNAALMEYIGPRPIYCAEHIELDPRSLYEKCKSSYQKEAGDNKGCKEVVLKEFGYCYKHYNDLMVDLAQRRDLTTIKRHQDRIVDLLHSLEKEATAAKKKDGDLYQRKNKLIPKFQEMKKIVTKVVEMMDASRDGSVGFNLSSYHSQVSTPESVCSPASSVSTPVSGPESPISSVMTPPHSDRPSEHDAITNPDDFLSETDLPVRFGFSHQSHLVS